MIQENDAAVWGRPFRKAIGILVVLLVLAIFPYSEDPCGDIKYLIVSWGSALLLVAWLYGVARHGWTIRRPTIFLEILVLLLALNAAASAFSSFRANSFAEFGRLWYLFVLYLVASQVYTDEHQIRRLMLTVCGAVCVASLYGVVIQKFGYDTFPWGDKGSDIYTSLPATFGNPNFAAHTLILAIIMAVYLATERRMCWSLGFVALFFIHLHYTGQRAGRLAMLAAVALLVIHALVRLRIRRPVRAVAVSLLVVGTLAVVGLAAAMGLSKMRTGSAYPLDLSLLIRYKSYASAAAMVMRHPVLGWGTGSYRIEYPAFWTQYEQRWFGEELRLNSHVHNDVIECAADAGLPAAGLYLAFLVLGMGYGLYMAARFDDKLKRRLGLTFAALFTAFLVDGLFGFNVHVPVSAVLLFVMAGAMEGFRRANMPDGHGSLFPLPRFLREDWKVVALAVSVVYIGVETCAFSAQVFFQDGMGLTQVKQYDRADTALKWAERLAPWYERATRQRGVIAIARRDWAGAIDHFDRALKRNPNYVMTLVALSRAQMSKALSEASEKNEPGEACISELNTSEATALRALKLCPMLPATEDLLGRIEVSRAMFTKATPGHDEQQVKESWQKAEDHFLKAVQYGSHNSSETYRQLAQVRMALLNYEGTESAIVRATQADPGDDDNWPFFYGFACKAKRYDRFAAALDWRIERLAEKKPPDRANLATAYLWKATIEQDGFHDLDEAERALRDAVTTMPARPDTWSAYAQFAETTQRQEGFKKFLLELTENQAKAEKTPLPHVAAIAKVWREGPNAIVDASVSLLNVIQGKVSVPGYHPAELDMRWAVLAIFEAVRATPPSTEDAGIAIMHLGMVCAGIKAFDLANQMFPAAMPRLNADFQRVCVQHWADVLLQLRRSLEAVALLQDMSGRFPDDNDLRLALARSLAKARRIDDARTQYAKIIDSTTADEGLRKAAQAELEKLPQPGNVSPK